MQKGHYAKKGLYAGTGTGLILFLLVGMFPGSLVGGAVGLMISNFMFGGPVEASIIPRMITVVSMVAGIIASAGVFIVGSSVLGWMVGTAADTVQAASEVQDLEEAKDEISS